MMNSGVKGRASRVSVPSGVKRMIENIKEITGQNHSEDEIYAMLKECSMDPNETAQKLLLLDTFHEVKRKRDRRKENLNREPAEKWKPGAQAKTNRAGRGIYPSRYVSHVMGRVKDFLGVVSDSNKKLMEERPDSCDIEVLTGNESNYIEMDLMLGIADLHTPEAVAAAESAMAGYHPQLAPFPESSSDEDSSSDDQDEILQQHAKAPSESVKLVVSKNAQRNSDKQKPNKTPKIVVLSLAEAIVRS